MTAGPSFHYNGCMEGYSMLDVKKDGTIEVKHKRRGKITVISFVVGIILLVFFMLISITQGAAKIPLSTVIEAFIAFEKSNSTHLLVMDMRLPRVIGSAFVGAGLAVAGSLMQGMTRNPLADTGIMGINSGAGLAIAICFAFLQGISYKYIIILSFIGAAISAILVYSISNLVPGNNDKMKLVLSGATISTLFSALGQAIAIKSNTTQNLSFWTMGSMAGTHWQQVKLGLPVILIAFIGGIILSSGITALGMGDDVALGLGVKIKQTKFIGTVLVVILAGTSVAVAGNVSFIGMLIPHFARFIVGPDYRRIIPVSGVFGALLLVVADLFSKIYNPPMELPVGAVIALLGVPVFLYFARKQKGDSYDRNESN